MIPQKISQTALNRLADPDEVVAIVVAVSGSGLGTYIVQGRSNRTFAFQFEKKRGLHVLRFPATFWHAKKGELSRELYDQSSTLALIPTVEPWDTTRTLAELTLVERAPVEVEAEPVKPETDPAPGAIETGNFIVEVIDGEPKWRPAP